MGMAIQIQYSSERFSPASSSDPLSLSLSLWYQKRRGKIERTEDARSMSNSKMYPCMYSIVYNIESAAATK